MAFPVVACLELAFPSQAESALESSLLSLGPNSSDSGYVLFYIDSNAFVSKLELNPLKRCKGYNFFPTFCMAKRWLFSQRVF